jgi:hypothetical protein
MADRNLPRELADRKGRTSGAASGDGSREGQLVAGVRGTVGRILHDGSGTEPFRAIVELRPHLFDLMIRPQLGKTINKTCIITSKQPLNVQPGDDIYATGVLFPSGDHALPSEIVIADDAPVFNRVRGQIEKGAEIKAFGTETAQQKLRPGMITTGKTAPAGKPAQFGVTKQGVVTVTAVTETRDDAISWASKLYKGIPSAGSISIIDPMAFLPEADWMDGKFGSGRRERNRVRGNTEKLQRFLPESTPEMVAGAMAKYIAVSPGLALPMLFDGVPGSERLAKEGFVVPFSPFFSSTLLWAGLSSLSANSFSPKFSVQPELQKAFIIAHEMAHTVQASYGIIHGRDIAGINLGEKFADSFACLAVAQKTGDIETLRNMARIRHNHLFLGGLTHWTGPAFDDAVALAEKLMQDGRLATMTAHEMLQTAHNIAQTHRLSQDEVYDIVSRRADVYDKVGIKTAGPGWLMRTLMKKRGYDPRVGHALDETGGRVAVPAIESALKEKNSPLGRWAPYFAKSVAALHATAWDLSELTDDATREKALQIYRNDLEANARLADFDPAVMKVLFRIEERTNDTTPRSLLGKLTDGFGPRPGMGTYRLQVLEDKREFYTGVTAKKRFDAALAGRLSTHTHANTREAVPVVTVRRALPESTLVKAMAMPRDQRLNALVQFISTEIKLLEAAIAKPQLRGALLTQATAVAAHRMDFAFAVRIDGAGYAEIKDKMGDDVAHLISEMAKHRGGEYKPEYMRPMLARLREMAVSFNAGIDASVTPEQAGVAKDLDTYLPEKPSKPVSLPADAIVVVDEKGNVIGYRTTTKPKDQDAPANDAPAPEDKKPEDKGPDGPTPPSQIMSRKFAMPGFFRR